MAIINEIWAQDIAANLFPNNSFMMRAINDDAFADAYGVVHLPTAGAKPTVERNRSTIPAAAVERTDTDATYNLDSYTSTPTFIRNAEELETSYDKRQSVLMEHVETLDEEIADWMAYHWAATINAQIVRTTGADRPATAPAATGTRKKITISDFLQAKRILDSQNIPDQNRYVLLPSTMYNDLLENGDVLTSDKMGTANLASGSVGRLLGFDIYIRSKTLIYDNAAIPALIQPGTAGVAAHNLAALFWHQNFVRKAKGQTTVFSQERAPGYYGDIFSAEILAGGRKRYPDQRGVVSLIEQP